MAVIKPFKALRPTKEKAAQVSAPAYDSANREKSYEELDRNPHSYLHVVKPYLHYRGEKKNPETHFPLGLKFMDEFRGKGFFIKDQKDSYYIYRVIKGSSAYTGIIASAAVSDYLNNTIRKHENTLTEKQQELAEHIRWFRQLGNPVLLTYPDSHAIDSLIEHYIEEHIPEYNFISNDQLKHNLWVVNSPEDVDLIRDEFERIPQLYIADGHHRSAGAATYALQVEKEGYASHEHHMYFPVCLIPFSKLSIYEYHRLIRDQRLHHHDWLSGLSSYFEVIPSGHLPVQPLKPKQFGIYFEHTAYLLKVKPELLTKLQTTLDQLDVSIVEEFILKRVLGIEDSKTDKRISFLDGTKGIGVLQESVDQGHFDLAITLYRTSVDEMITVADQGLIMPPKSTWIEPKLRSGLIIYETV